MEVKKVGIEAIPVIQSLAHTTWAVAYKNILSDAQMSYMLEMSYSTAALQDQIENQQHQFILILVDDIPAGFASYSLKPDNTGRTFKLHKIYIDPGQQARGIGKTLLNYIRFDIISHGAKQLELNVNRQNKALGFYKKMGFTIIAEKDISIGNGYFMNDYIMRLDLP